MPTRTRSSAGKKVSAKEKTMYEHNPNLVLRISDEPAHQDIVFVHLSDSFLKNLGVVVDMVSNRVSFDIGDTLFTLETSRGIRSLTSPIKVTNSNVLIEAITKGIYLDSTDAILACVVPRSTYNHLKEKKYALPKLQQTINFI